MLLGIFVTIIFSARISGSHFNPCITFSYLIQMSVGNVKHGNFDSSLGILYIVAQCLGAFLGVLFSEIFSKNATMGDGKIPLYVENTDMFKQLLIEILGSFFLVFMYQCSTDKKTQFTTDSAIQTMILAGSQLAAMLLAGTIMKSTDTDTVGLNIKVSPVNPAIALFIIIFNSTKKSWASIWVFVGGSFIGSLVSVLFFRCIYKRTTEKLEEMEEEENAIAEAEDL